MKRVDPFIEEIIVYSRKSGLSYAIIQRMTKVPVGVIKRIVRKAGAENNARRAKP